MTGRITVIIAQAGDGGRQKAAGTRAGTTPSGHREIEEARQGNGETTMRNCD